MARSGKQAGKPSTLRIIGGRWRGRKLSFLPAEGLRPTTDRVRETLFNWLAPDIQQARCLDLFAGSGALGLEALSRGATSCDFVDTSAAALRQIASHLETLGAGNAGHCHKRPALIFLQDAGGPYDILFIDPPFGASLVDPSCEQLATLDLVAPGGLIYIETATGEEPPRVPASWTLHRDKVAGGVAYRLYRNDLATAAPGGH